MVAIASPTPRIDARSWGTVWSLAGVGVLVLGAVVRLAMRGAGVGERSALVMMLLLVGCTWLAARYVAGPRVALFAAVVATVLFDVAALAPRDQPVYDDLQAFYSTDQVLSANAPIASGGATAINVLVQPVFGGAQPRFGLAGDVNGTAYQWTCQFTHGIQTIALPVAAEGTVADLSLHLTGSPSRDGDYLIVYASSRQGGFIVSARPADQSATHCNLV